MRVLINKPIVSKTIAAFYVSLAVSITALIMAFTYLAILTGFIELVYASIILIPVAAILIRLLTSLYEVRYIITDKELVVRVTRLIRISKEEKRVPFTSITSIKRTLIPFGFRLFGASFYGGYFYIPGLGRAFMTITNFRDGVLIEAGKRNYIITPSNPDEFVRVLEGCRSRLSQDW